MEVRRILESSGHVADFDRPSMPDNFETGHLRFQDFDTMPDNIRGLSLSDPVGEQPQAESSSSPEFTRPGLTTSVCSSSSSSSHEESPIIRSAVPDRVPFTCVARDMWVYIKPARWTFFEQDLLAELEKRGGPVDSYEADGCYHLADMISLTLNLTRESRDKYHVLVYNMFRNMARDLLGKYQSPGALGVFCNCVASNGTLGLPILQYHQMVLATLIGETAFTSHGEEELYDVQRIPGDFGLKVSLQSANGMRQVILDARGVVRPPMSFEEEKLRGLWLFTPWSKENYHRLGNDTMPQAAPPRV